VLRDEPEVDGERSPGAGSRPRRKRWWWHGDRRRHRSAGARGVLAARVDLGQLAGREVAQLGVRGAVGVGREQRPRLVDDHGVGPRSPAHTF
jgi:hypothetical protein